MSSLTDGTAYYFTVEAIGPGGASAPSSEVSATPEPPAPAAPSGLSATAGDSQVSLSWGPVTGAGSYEVFDATTPGAEDYSGTPACTTSTTSCTVSSLTDGTAYYFTVEAIGLGGASAPSSEVSATPEAAPPSTTTTTTLTATTTTTTTTYNHNPPLHDHDAPAQPPSG